MEVDKLAFVKYFASDGVPQEFANAVYTNIEQNSERESLGSIKPSDTLSEHGVDKPWGIDLEDLIDFVLASTDRRLRILNECKTVETVADLTIGLWKASSCRVQEYRC